jgi:malonyl CoA-acyl carrier protein transacylase
MSRAEQQELIDMVVFAGVQVQEQEIKEGFRINPMMDKLWHESSAAQVLLEEGRLEGLRAMAQIVLQARFGVQDEPLKQTIQSAPVVVLTDVMAQKDLTLEQVRARMK